MDVDRIRPADRSVATVSLLQVAGEVDCETAPDLRAHLAGATVVPSSVLVVDLLEVTFMSCSGLRPLLEARARVGDRLWLRDPSRPVRRLLDLTGTRAAFGILADSDDPARPGAPRHRRPRPRPDGPLAGRPGVPVPALRGTALRGTAAAFALRADVVGLQDEIRRGIVVEQAKGLLMGLHRCDAALAWQLLIGAARVHGRSVPDLAAALVDWTEAGGAEPSTGVTPSPAVRALTAGGPARS